jgi:hypothetical protein
MTRLAWYRDHALRTNERKAVSEVARLLREFKLRLNECFPDRYQPCFWGLVVKAEESWAGYLRSRVRTS